MRESRGNKRSSHASKYAARRGTQDGGAAGSGGQGCPQERGTRTVEQGGNILSYSSSRPITTQRVHYWSPFSMIQVKKSIYITFGTQRVFICPHTRFGQCCFSAKEVMYGKRFSFGTTTPGMPKSGLLKSPSDKLPALQSRWDPSFR